MTLRQQKERGWQQQAKGGVGGSRRVAKYVEIAIPLLVRTIWYTSKLQKEMAMGRIAYECSSRRTSGRTVGGTHFSCCCYCLFAPRRVAARRRGLQHWDRRLEQLEVIPKTIHFVFVDRRLKFSLRSLFLYIICLLYVEAFPLFFIFCFLL